MTYARRPGTIEAALTDSIQQLTPAEIERATGKSLSLFYKAANPIKPAALHLVDAVSLDAALIVKGEPPRLLRRARELKHARVVELGGRPIHEPQHPLDRLAGVMAELGDVAGEVRAACCGSSPHGRGIDEREAARILAEVDEAETELAKLKADVHAAIVRRPRVVA